MPGLLAMRTKVIAVAVLALAPLLPNSAKETSSQGGGSTETRTPRCSSPPTCKTNPNLVGKCFSVRGRMNYWNGTPSTRIWVIGTHHMLDLPCEDAGLPQDIRAHFQDFDDEVTGVFEVCPFSKDKKGQMQSACVESVSLAKFGRSQR
jgi:hypothetical protein